MFGWFIKRSKREPEILDFDGIPIRREGDRWEFTFEGVEFYADDACFEPPSADQLHDMTTQFSALRPEMLRIVTEWAAEQAILVPASGYGLASSLILSNFHDEGTWDVQWSGDASWGDLFYNFTIRNGVIVAHWGGD